MDDDCNSITYTDGDGEHTVTGSAGVFFSNEVGMEGDRSTKIVSTEEGIKIQEYLNSAYSVYGDAIDRYREPRQLVSLAAESKGRLIPTFQSITYDENTGLFTITNLTVCKAGSTTPLAKLDSYTIRAVAVPYTQTNP